MYTMSQTRESVARLFSAADCSSIPDAHSGGIRRSMNRAQRQPMGIIEAA